MTATVGKDIYSLFVFVPALTYLLLVGRNEAGAWLFGGDGRDR